MKLWCNLFHTEPAKLYIIKRKEYPRNEWKKLVSFVVVYRYKFNEKFLLLYHKTYYCLILGEVYIQYTRFSPESGSIPFSPSCHFFFLPYGLMAFSPDRTIKRFDACDFERWSFQNASISLISWNVWCNRGD